MTRRLACVQDGVEFEAKSPHAKFCSMKCRKASSRGTPPITAVASKVAKDAVPGGGTVAAARVELEAAGRLNSVLGAAALALAERIDNATAVMGFAALVKELRMTMAAATADVAIGDELDDALDEVAERRAKRAAG